MSGVSVRVNTYAHSVTYLTDQLMNSLKKIIILAGLDIGNFVGSWATTELGVKTWLNSRHIERIILEIYNPDNDKLVTRWDLDIDFTLDSNADGEFWTDTDALHHAIKKCGAIPQKCKYRIVITNKDGRPDVAGWSSCTLRSTDGLSKRSVGTTVDAGTVGAGSSYWS